MTKSIFNGFLPFIILIAIFSKNSFSQNIETTASKSIVSGVNENVYGLDPSLYNGLIYTSFNQSKVKGDQYFLNSEYQKGEVTIRGVCYKNLDLNYDIYRQELLLKFLNPNNVYSIIMVSKAWLEGFKIGNTIFKIYEMPEKTKRIYQVLGNDSLQLYYYWQKKVEYFNNYAGYTNLWFSIKKEQNIVIKNKIYPFQSNNSFLRCFNKDQQKVIKKYLHQNKVKVNNASDQIMEELINYCSKISIN